MTGPLLPETAQIAPYYEDDLVRLYKGKFEDVLPTLDLGHVDAIVTDPPYGETSLQWDRWPDGWPSVAAEHARSMWVFGSMRMFLDRSQEFAGWRLSQDIVWEKQNGSGFHADRFKRVHEHAVHWYRGDWAAVHHEPVFTPDATARVTRRKTRPTHMGRIEESAYTSLDGGPRLARSVIYCPNMHGRAINETEKPVPLVVPLIEYAVPVGGLVLDLFAGSSSTLEAARMTGRRCIGIEMREEQCERAATRLSQQMFDLASVVIRPGLSGSS